MKVILVSVDYADLLALTLPYNKHHFEEVLVVTTPQDLKTHRVVYDNRVDLFTTEAFYDNGAMFNKWKALEQGLDFLGREGLLCIMDADVLWPKQISYQEFESGCLYTPLCRLVLEIPKTLPPEKEWDSFPLRPNQTEWTGYSQIFHAEDPCLGPAPWHEINWSHAGGADSFFQRKWDTSKKLRPNFEALHLGPHGKNWCGRVTNYINGKTPTESEACSQQLRQIFTNRRKYRNFNKEKI